MTHTFLTQLRNPVLPPLIGGGSNPDYNTGGAALGKLISNIVGALFIAAFLLAFIFLIMGGFNWITAGGDKAKLEQARNQITNALIGIIIVAAAYALTRLIAQFFGLNLNALPIPTISQDGGGGGASPPTLLQSVLQGISQIHWP